MKKLKYLTLYRERRYFDRVSSEPSIEDNMNILSDDLAIKIINYMSTKITLINFVSKIHDPYDNDIVSNSFFSDGKYLWDGIIMHWIKKYKIKLPNEFIIHVNNSELEGDENIKNLDKQLLIKRMNHPEIILID